MIKPKLLIFSIFTILYFSNVASAQYYASPIDPCNLKWWQIKNKEKGAIIFPDYILEKALSVSFYRDTISSFIDYAIPTKMRKFKISLHPTNVISNGMVTYTPSRMELYTMPSRDNYSLQWTKQLVAHEYRHVAQLSNLNVGFTKVFSYVLGEQMLGLTAILIPSYFYEGDATAAETEMAIYGRGKQPSFNLLMRSMAYYDDKINPITLKLGAFNKQMPDQYELGYFVTRFATEDYGDDFWFKVLRYTGRNPYLIDPCWFAYRKYGDNLSCSKLIKRTFAELRNFWAEASDVENKSTIINTDITSYTTYAYPLPLDSNTIIAHKTDLDRSGRFVVVDIRTGDERVVHNTGYVTSRPVISGDKIYWCENVPSLSWGQKNSSVIFSATITKEAKSKGDNLLKSYKIKKVKAHKNIKGDLFFVTPIGDDRLAMVDYDKQNNPSIVIKDKNFNELKRFDIEKDDTSFNGLTWDNITESLYAAIVDDNGTSLVRLNESNGMLENVKPSNYGTITSLSASDGYLYYSSIDTGKDEVHIFDLKDNKEYLLSTSKFGSKASTPVDLWSVCDNKSDKMLMTTYTKDGYMIATQSIEKDSLKELSYRFTPDDKLNYPFRSWNIPKLDTINYKNSDSVKPKERIRKYNKFANAINIHSWMPLYLDTKKLIDDRSLSLGFGVNLLSQNILNSVITSIGYGYVNGGFNLLEGSVTYKGLPVHLSAKISYGGGYKIVLDDQFSYYDRKKQYTDFDFEAQLPFNLSKGGLNRFLNFGVSYNFTNTSFLYRSYDSAGNYNVNVNDGLHKMEYFANFQISTRRTQKELNPRLGVFMQLGGTLNPVNSDFSKIYYIYGKAYLPGPFRNGSISLAGAYQVQPKRRFWYQQTILFPRGVENNFFMNSYASGSASYSVPLFYPNVGLGSILHFQRISAKVFYDFAKANLPYYVYNVLSTDFFTSYGLDLIIDFNLFGIKQPLQLVVSGYIPSDDKTLNVSLGFNINF